MQCNSFQFIIQEFNYFQGDISLFLHIQHKTVNEENQTLIKTPSYGAEDLVTGYACDWLRSDWFSFKKQASNNIDHSLINY